MNDCNQLKEFLIKTHPIYKNILFIKIIKYIEENIIKNYQRYRYITKFLIKEKGIFYRYYIIEHFKIHGFNVELFDCILFIYLNLKLINY